MMNKTSSKRSLVIEDKNWDQHAFSHNVCQNKAFAGIVTDLGKQGVS
jgi:hypothetical protein